MNVIEAIILGIVQGLTEFLPVSSSGHLEIGTFLFGIQTSENLLFSVLVHGATALSTIIVFRKDLMTLIREGLKFKDNESTRYILLLVISMVPVGVIGVFFKSDIESFFGGKIAFVASMLMITGLLLTISHFIKDPKNEVKPMTAFIIGLAQAIALLPGISRSGATISTALILGVAKEKAARFSFLMVLAPILGASILQLKEFLETTDSSNSIPAISLIAGFLAALISGIVACKWMIKLVNQGKLIYFAAYCFVIATIIMVYYW